MDVFYRRAKSLAQETVKKSQKMAQDFALETAKRSQEIAVGTAKLSQELASETAKKSQEIALHTAIKSKELAAQATKKADELKVLAGQLAPLSAPAKLINFMESKPSESQAELEEYGISEELKEFVRGLTMQTFLDFPLDDADVSKITENLTGGLVSSGQELTEWQERHAVLVLSAVKEMSNFRYVLCPRRMQESRFWKIYFLLVHNHVGPYEMKAAKGFGVKQSTEEEDITVVTTSPKDVIMSSPEQNDLRLPLPKEAATPSVKTLTDRALDVDVSTSSEQAKSGPGGGDEAQKPNAVDQDLDSYLMEVLGGADDGPDAANGDDSDLDFEELVNMEAVNDDEKD